MLILQQLSTLAKCAIALATNVSKNNKAGEECVEYYGVFTRSREGNKWADFIGIFINIHCIHFIRVGYPSWLSELLDIIRGFAL